MSHTRRLAPISPFLPFLGLAAVLIFQATSEPSPFDDAFITFRYARNIATGTGFVYNPDQQVLGTTTPSFSAVLAFIGLLLGPDFIPQAAFLVGTVADCISAWLIFRLALSAFSNELLALVLSLAFALMPFRLAVASGGMEASLVTFLILLTFERLVLAHDLVSGSLFAAFALLTRPDALIPVAMILTYLLLRDRQSALRAGALVTVLVAPWIVWATIQFGSPLPQSIAAKANAYQFSPGFAAYFILSFLGTGTLAQYTFTPLLLTASLATFAAVLIGTIVIARHHPKFTPLVGYAPVFLILMTLANAPMYFPWYYYPILPSLLFAVSAFLWFLPLPRKAPRLGLLAATVIATLLISARLMQSSPSWPLSREREIAYLDACQYLQTNAIRGDVLLAPDIGVIGWCLPDVEILDPIGLVSPGALPYLAHRRQGPAIPLQLVLDARPDYIVALDQYTLPFLRPSSEFATAYQLAWSRSVTIAGRTQQLNIFRFRWPSGP